MSDVILLEALKEIRDLCSSGEPFVGDEIYDIASYAIAAADPIPPHPGGREMSGKIIDPQVLLSLADNPAWIEFGRKAIEDALIEFRESRISQPMRGNGLVVREKDGNPSSHIRMGPDEALRIGLKAIAEALLKNPRPEGREGE